MLAGLGTWMDEIITEEDYEEEGPNCIHKLNILTQ